MTRDEILEALRPFALCNLPGDLIPEDYPIRQFSAADRITAGDLRRARRVYYTLKAQAAPEGEKTDESSHR